MSNTTTKDFKLVPLSGTELASRLATALQNPNKMNYYVYENEQGELVFPAAPSIVLPVGHVDSEGRVRQGDASGQMPVVEGSAANISSRVNYVSQNTSYINAPYFATKVPGTSVAQVNSKLILSVTLTATGGGEIAIADLVPALAGYQSCMLLKRIWSDQTDGSINLTIATATGLDNGPGAVNIATVANTVTPDWADGIPYRGGTDNEAITVLAAAGQCGAAQVVTFIGEYWYET